LGVLEGGSVKRGLNGKTMKSLVGEPRRKKKNRNKKEKHGGVKTTTWQDKGKKKPN